MLTKENVLYSAYAIESHAQDARYKINEINQTLGSNMEHDAANGGLLMTYKKSSHAKSKDDGQGWEETEVNDTLNVFDSGEARTPTVIIEKQTVYDWHRQDTRMTECGDICVTAAAGWGGGGNNMPYVLEERTMEESKEPVLLESTHSHATTNENGIATTLVKSMEQGKGYVPMVTQGINGDTAGTLDSNYFKGCGEREGTEREVVCVGNGQLAQLKMSDKAHALDCMHDQQAVMENLVVRRLTPKECSRLQGYPDGWMDIGEWTDSKGKKHNISHRILCVFRCLFCVCRMIYI